MILTKMILRNLDQSRCRLLDTLKTTFKNNGPGNVIVNCQRQRADRHDWKIDAGSGKTYQSEYHLDHVQPGTYIEPGLGLPEGTERGIFGTQGEKREVER